MSELILPAQAPSSNSVNGAGQFAIAVGRLKRDNTFCVASAIAGVIALCAVLAPWIAPWDPEATQMLSRLLPIGSPDHFLGTDELGRDLLSRLIYGGRLSLTMALLPVCCAFAIGSGLGILAGYAGGYTNAIIMRGIDVFFAFPSVLLAVAISGTLGASATNVILSLIVVFIPPICRVAESVTAQNASLEYVDAARISGASSFAIIRVHLIGNVIGPVFVYASSLVSVSIILASGLSFLGLGVSPPTAEWGLMLNALRTAIYSQPLVAILPGVMIFLCSTCFNLMSDSVRNAMDIKS